jgi:hypothetical protein
MSFAKETVGSLESLSLQNIESEDWDTFLVPPPNSNPWKELRCLALGNEENVLFINGSTISDFLSSSPELESLDINVPRPASLRFELHIALDSAKTLRHLTLRISSPDLLFTHADLHDNETLLAEYRSFSQRYNIFGDEMDDFDELATQTALLGLFKGLRIRKQGKLLETLDVYVGNWGDREGCGLILGPSLRIAFYECFVDEREVERCEGTQTRNRGMF